MAATGRLLDRKAKCITCKRVHYPVWGGHKMCRRFIFRIHNHWETRIPVIPATGKWIAMADIEPPAESSGYPEAGGEPLPAEGAALAKAVALT